MSVLGFIGSIGQSILNYNQQQENNELQQRLQQSQNAFNERMSSVTYNRQLKQWFRENSYNSPSAQMQRLRDAGINPALAYSNGMNQQAATLPNVDGAQQSSLPLTHGYFGDPALSAQIELMDAQAEAVRHNTAREDEKLGHSINLTDTQVSSLKYLTSLYSEQTKTEQMKQLGLKTQAELDEARKNVLGLDYVTKERTLESTIQQVLDSGKITHAEADMIYKSLNAQYKILVQKLENMKSEKDLTEQQESYYNALYWYYVEDVKPRMEQLTRYYGSMSDYWGAKTPYVGFREVTTGFRDGAAGLRNISDGILNWYTKGGISKAETFKPTFSMDKNFNPNKPWFKDNKGYHNYP